MKRLAYAVVIAIVLLLAGVIGWQKYSQNKREQWFLAGPSPSTSTSGRRIQADGENAGVEVDQSSSRGSSAGAIVGVWKGEIGSTHVTLCFRRDGTGFMTGDKTLTFRWTDTDEYLAITGRDTGGSDKYSAKWPYEWMEKNLILRLDDVSVVFSRAPEVAK